MTFLRNISTALLLVFSSSVALAQVDIAPTKEASWAPFSNQDISQFKSPDKLYYPETWFHFIGHNVSREGITADLEAIAAAGISGVQLFHGNSQNDWPGQKSQITILTPEWEEMVKYAASEAKRLGLRFTMQTCPGWAMAGGPWITPENAQRDLASKRVFVDSDGSGVKVHIDKPYNKKETWRDYRDICVLAYPTPEGQTDDSLRPENISSNDGLDWQSCLVEGKEMEIGANGPHIITFTLPEGSVVRTLQLPNINSLSHSDVYVPEVHVTLEATTIDGQQALLADFEMPSSAWQDRNVVDVACNEVSNAKSYKLTIRNGHSIDWSGTYLLSEAKTTDWAARGGWTLHEITKPNESISQVKEAFIDRKTVVDITQYMQADGTIVWPDAPKGKWTIELFGHVNCGRKNGPAPKEATGWECNKMNRKGAEAQFNNYVGRLVKGPLQGGLVQGYLMDSWECATQTWTEGLDSIFKARNGYDLRPWLPAVFGSVVDNHEATARFYDDWLSTMTSLYLTEFYEPMVRLANEHGMKMQFETAFSDVVAGDMLEYYKYADVPMCEFWQPFEDNFVGSLSFKPIKPTASAAHIYGKTRVAAESFTSFQLTWNEHFEQLKDVNNINMVEGVTHNVFHTYTHNPQVGFLPPGTSFGGGIGTPFLRGQTWWKYMKNFTTYLARTGYMLERGRPVVDVLWYIGDECDHHPNQLFSIGEGYKYDYCNPDVLLNRLSVVDGKLQTPDGQQYSLLWMPKNYRMLPETLEWLAALVKEGATVVGNAPVMPATPKNPKFTEKRFRKAVRQIWGKAPVKGIRKVGKGRVLSGLSIEESLALLHIQPDVTATGGKVNWVHRQAEGADWYFITAPKQETFDGTVKIHKTGVPELWDQVSGKVYDIADYQTVGEYTYIPLSLAHAGSCFIVFRKVGQASEHPKYYAHREVSSTLNLTNPWTINFPEGWGAPKELTVKELLPWKDLDMTAEGKAFSGTATYQTTFNIDRLDKQADYMLNLGDVDMIAEVQVNGQPADVVWAAPYEVNIGKLLHEGENQLSVAVTSTWYNRLVYDAGKPENERKTWTINGPKANKELKATGLLGPVSISEMPRK